MLREAVRRRQRVLERQRLLESLPFVAVLVQVVGVLNSPLRKP